MTRAGSATAPREPAVHSPRHAEAEADRFAARATAGSLSRLVAGVPFGRGSLVAGPVRSGLEQASGVDLSSVRVHDLPMQGAPGLRPGLSFTHGSDIALGQGGGVDRPRMLAHEVAHVVQHQGGGRGLSDLSSLGPSRGHGLQGDGGLTDEELAALRDWVASGDSPLESGQRIPFPGDQRIPFPGDPVGSTTGPVSAVSCPGGCHGSTDPRWRGVPPPAPRRTREQWEASHRAEHGAHLAGPQTGLAADIRTTGQQLVEQRRSLLVAAAEATAVPAADPQDPFGRLLLVPPPGWSRPVFPATLPETWATAHRESVLLSLLAPTGQLTPETAASPRVALVDYYRVAVAVAEQSDRAEAQRERESRALVEGMRTSSPECPGSCHTSASAPPPRVYEAPRPSAPGLRQTAGLVAAAETPVQWQGVVSGFEVDTTVLDALALSVVPANIPAAQGFLDTRALLGRQQQVAAGSPEAVRIRTVFYPEDRWIPAPDRGSEVEIAEGIPWFFYLTHTPVSTPYSYPSGFTWFLRDVTQPNRPEVSYRPNDVERYLRSGELHVDQVPRVLFEKLNDSLIFSKGIVYWRYPDGRSDSLRTTEPWSLSDWLGAIGLTLAGLGVILLTGGAGTPAVLAALGVASASFGVAATLSDLSHRDELGILTQADKDRAVLAIAVDVASALSLGLGQAAGAAGRAATAAGRVTRLTVVVQRSAQVAGVVDRTLGYAYTVTMAADYVRQYEAIMASNLPTAEKERALRELTQSAIFTGGVVLAPAALSRVAAAVRPRGVAHPDVPGRLSPPTATVHHTTEPSPGWSRVPSADADFLAQSTRQERLPSADAARELQLAQRHGTERRLSGDPEYTRAIDFEGHTWRERIGGGWCRHSTKVCYPAIQVQVGITGTVERVTAATTADLTRLRAELARPPRSARTERGRLDWADYAFYVERRLRMIETALAAGATPPPPPRTFASFVTDLPPGHPGRNNIQGSRFEERTRAAINDPVHGLGPERGQLALAQHNISETLNPTTAEGMLTRPDLLLPDLGDTWTAVSNKSRSSFAGMQERAAQSQVWTDLDEARRKYSGTRHVRRTGETVEVSRVWLLYDAAGVPERLRPTIKKAVRDYQRHRSLEGNALTFEVGIF